MKRRTQTRDCKTISLRGLLLSNHTRNSKAKGNTPKLKHSKRCHSFKKQKQNKSNHLKSSQIQLLKNVLQTTHTRNKQNKTIFKPLFSTNKIYLVYKHLTQQ